MTVFCFCIALQPWKTKRTFAVCFCLSWSVSVKDPVLRDTLSGSSALLSGMRLPEVHGVMRRNSSLGQILGVLI